MNRAVVLLVILSASAAGAQNLPHPPFRKACELAVLAANEPATVTEHCLRGNLICFAAQNQFGVGDMDTGRVVWRRSLAGDDPLAMSGPVTLAVDGGRVYAAASCGRLYACDAATGRSLWSLRRSTKATPMLAAGGVLYCELGGGVVTALDTTTRRPRWQLRVGARAPRQHQVDSWVPGLSGLSAPPPPPEPAAESAAAPKTPPAGVRTLRSPAGSPPGMSAGPRRSSDPVIAARPLLAAGRLYVATQAGRLLCIDPRRGTIVWVKAWNPSMGPMSALTADSRALYLRCGRHMATALDLRTGRVLWTAPCAGGFDTLALAGSIAAVPCADGVLRALDRLTGRICWERAVASQTEAISAVSYGGRLLVTAEDHSFDTPLERAFGSGSRLLAFDTAGRRLWEWHSDEALWPAPLLHRDGLVLSDGSSFFRFVPGEPPTAPTDPQARRSLAAGLAARLDTLSTDESRTLARLGRDAYDALLPVARERLTRMKETWGRSRDRDDATLAAADRLHASLQNALQMLSLVAAPGCTPDLLALVELDRTSEPALGCLIDAGDPDQAIPCLCGVVRGAPASAEGWGAGPAGSALQALVASRHPAAVRFLIEQLLDPGAVRQVRAAALLSLAATGGVRGVEAVLRAQNTGCALPTIAEYLDLSGLPTVSPALGSFASEDRRGHAGLVAKGTDGRGVRWGIVRSCLLGCDGDLWLCRYDGKRWVEPVYTGEAERPDLGDWIGRLVGNVALTRDVDGDGWTDLVEQRLGTDPGKADTDGDGLRDSEDRNPLVARGPLTEEQEILAAAFEGCFRFTDEDDQPYLVQLPTGIAPMEFRGYDWLVIAAASGSAPGLSRMVGEGVARIQFGPPAYGFDGREYREGRRDRPFLWSGDRSEVKLHLAAHYGSLSASGRDVRVRRFENHWIAVEVQPVWKA